MVHFPDSRARGQRCPGVAAIVAPQGANSLLLSPAATAVPHPVDVAFVEGRACLGTEDVLGHLRPALREALPAALLEEALQDLT